MLEIELNESLRRRRNELNAKIDSLGEAESGDSSAIEELEKKRRELDALNKSIESLTKKIQGSLSRLETSGKTVEEAIAPIYSNTQRLQVTNRSMWQAVGGIHDADTAADIDNVIEVIDRYRKPLDQRDREDQVIRQE